VNRTIFGTRGKGGDSVRTLRGEINLYAMRVIRTEDSCEADEESLGGRGELLTKEENFDPEDYRIHWVCEGNRGSLEKKKRIEEYETGSFIKNSKRRQLGTAGAAM